MPRGHVGIASFHVSGENGRGRYTKRAFSRQRNLIPGRDRAIALSNAEAAEKRVDSVDLKLSWRRPSSRPPYNLPSDAGV